MCSLLCVLTKQKDNGYNTVKPNLCGQGGICVRCERYVTQVCMVLRPVSQTEPEINLANVLRVMWSTKPTKVHLILTKAPGNKQQLLLATNKNETRGRLLSLNHSPFKPAAVISAGA